MAKTAAATVPGPAPADASADAPKKKSKRLLIVAVALVLACGSGAGWYFTAGKPAGEGKEAPVKAPIFMTVDPFTVNLAEENGDHYLQVGVVYQVEDDKVIEQLKLYMPVLRNRVLLLLSAKKPSDLAGADGKNKLVGELVAAARSSIPGTAPEKGIAGALLASFVIQ